MSEDDVAFQQAILASLNVRDVSALAQARPPLRPSPAASRPPPRPPVVRDIFPTSPRRVDPSTPSTRPSSQNPVSTSTPARTSSFRDRGTFSATPPAGRGSSARRLPASTRNPPPSSVASRRNRPAAPPPKPSKKRDGPEDEADKLRSSILDEIVSDVPSVTFDEVIACEAPKRLLKEALVLPLAIPEFFTGLRTPWRGVLLFGPPGTGKTMLAKAVASQCKATFFNVTASSIMSKWHGESEKLLSILFKEARARAPSVVFFDEIDMIGTARGGSNEHEASRRLKGQLLTAMDGLTSTADAAATVMVLAATNTPWALDEALRRRLEKRVYVPLPDGAARASLYRYCMSQVPHTPDATESSFVEEVARMTERFSCADLHVLCRDVAMAPIRRLMDASPELLHNGGNTASGIRVEDHPCTRADVESALTRIRASSSADDAAKFEKWFSEYGSA